MDAEKSSESWRQSGKKMPQGLRKEGIARMEFAHGQNLTHVDRGNDRKVIIWFVL